MADKPVGNMRFGINFDGLDESLNTLDKLNRAIRQTESAMKTNISTMDKGSTSMNDLAQKQKDLTTTTELQAKKVQLLEKRREEYIATYGKESKQVSNVTKQINDASVKYNKYSKELNATKQAYILAEAGVDKYTKGLKDNEKAMNDEIKAFKEAGDKAGELEAKQRGLTKQAELTEQAIESQKQAINKMAQEFGESSTQVAQAQTKLEEFKRSAKNTDTRLEGVTNSLSELKREASNVDDKVDKAGDSLEEAGKQGNKAEDGFKSATKEFSALATGLAVSISTKALDMAIEAADALKESFNEVVEASNTFQGKMGITKDESKQFLNFANELVKSGMVDSLEEAQEAITQVYQTAGKKVTPEGLKQLTKYAISFSKTFDTDVNETMRGASRMMENFGISAEEAFDLLTAGAQNGLNQSNELADNMAEYSQLFGQMGFTADETFSLLEAGLDGGAYNLDKVNDLIKEMGISLTDGRFEENADMFSESTRNLFNEWKNGKATQGEVVKSMMNDFANMEDGYDALNRAGTVWSALGEDNSLKVIEAMAGASTSFGETKGSAEDLNNTMTNTTAWEAFTNGVKGTVNSIAIWAQEFSGGMREPIENFFNNTLPNAMGTLDVFLTQVGDFISNLKDVIGKMWSGEDTVSYQHILNMMGFSWESIWALDDFITQVKEKGEVLTQYIKGFWQLFTGDEATQMEGYSLLRSLGMSQEDIKTLETAKENVKTALKSVKKVIVKLLEEGLDKMIQAWEDLVKIWQEEIEPDLLPLFEQFTGWLSRILGYLADVSGALDNFGGSSQSNSNVVVNAFGLIWEGVKIKLGLIMATIETAMIIISSTIKIWSKIFQGDWAGAWEEIKGMFDSISESIKTNLKNTFLGDMITSIEEWNTRTTAAFTGWISDVSTKFGGWLTKMKNWFQNLPGELADKFKSGGHKVANAFKSVFNGALRAIGKPINGIIKGASWVLEKLGAEPLKEWEVPQYAKGTPAGGHPVNGPMMVNDGRGAETVITPDGRAFIPKGRNVVLNAPKGTHVLTAEETAQLQGSKAPKYRYKKGTNFFGNLWSNVKGFAGNVGNKLKNVVGDVWDFVSNPEKLAKKVLGGLDVLGGLTKYPLDVGKGILSKATSALTSKISEMFSASSGNLDLGIGTAGVYKYLADIAKSVLSKYPGFQVTSGYRPGDPYSHGKRNAIDIALPGVTGGSSRYTEAANYAFEKFAGKVGYVITNGKVRDRSGQSGTGIHNDWRPWPDGDHYDHVHINGIKDPQNKQISGENIGGSGVDRWRGVATQALKMTGQYSTANLNALLNQMRTESNGNPNAINNWDINALNGTPSKGLLQVIDPTFRQYAMPGHNSNIFDPLSNILASIRYALSRYGSLTNAYRGVGYENGGIITKEHIARVGEGNKEEVVIPLTGSGLKRSRAMQLLAYASEKLGASTASISSTTGNTSNVSDMAQILALMQEQNQLLMAILAKDTNLYMDGTKVNSKLNTIQETKERNQRRNLGLV